MEFQEIRSYIQNSDGASGDETYLELVCFHLLQLHPQSQYVSLQQLMHNTVNEKGCAQGELQ